MGVRNRLLDYRRNQITEAQDRILEVIKGGVHYGYDIGRAAKVRVGILYPALHNLENAGLLIAEFEDTGAKHERRVYFYNEHEDFCPLKTGTGPCRCRAARVCPKCEKIVRYDGWDHVHPNGLGIGSCR